MTYLESDVVHREDILFEYRLRRLIQTQNADLQRRLSFRCRLQTLSAEIDIEMLSDVQGPSLLLK
jgi:hypothetical protein